MGHRQRRRHCCSASWRRAIRAGRTVAHGRANCRQQCRRGVWLPHDSTVKSPKRRHAPLQICWQYLSYIDTKLAYRCSPQRVAHGLPRLPRQFVARCFIREQFQLLRLRHTNHFANDWFTPTNHRNTNPHILRRRNLACQHHQIWTANTWAHHQVRPETPPQICVKV